MTTPPDEPGPPQQPPALRPDVIELLICFDPRRSLFPTHLVHLNGQPYTPEENQKFASATAEEGELAERFITASGDHLQIEYDAVTNLINTGLATSVPEHDARAFREAVTGPETQIGDHTHTMHQIDALATEESATAVTAFRAHILPHLTGRPRGEAFDRLDYLNPAGTSEDDKAALARFLREKANDLERIAQFISRYGGGHSNLEQCWSRIPETGQAEARQILERLGWPVPEA